MDNGQLAGLTMAASRDRKKQENSPRRISTRVIVVSVADVLTLIRYKFLLFVRLKQQPRSTNGSCRVLAIAACLGSNNSRALTGSC